MKKFTLILLFLVINYTLSTEAQVNTLLKSPYSFKITQELFKDLNKDIHSGFQVVLKDFVNFNTLSHSNELLKNMDHKTKGNVIVDALKKVADSSQKNIISYLNSQNIKYKSLWISNSIVIFQNEKNYNLISSFIQRKEVTTLYSISYKKLQNFETPKNGFDFLKTRLKKKKNIGWNIKWINAEKIWEKGFTGKGITIANIDTGVNFTHSGLRKQYRGTVSESKFDHDYNWWDGIRRGRSNKCWIASEYPCDDNGHGTHVTGTQVGNDEGDYVGSAPDAKWIACRGFNNGFYVSYVVEDCMQFFIAPTKQNGRDADPSKRPDIISHSYAIGSSVGLMRAFDAITASGVINIAAAGNTQNSVCSIIRLAPATYPNVVTVGALSEMSNEIAWFSRKGPGLESLKALKPDIVAPGERIVSYATRGGKLTMSGTSMATPLVAGGVALLWSAYPSLKGNVEATFQILKDGSQGIPNNECGNREPVPNYVYGYGNMDVLRSYNLLSGK